MLLIVRTKRKVNAMHSFIHLTSIFFFTGYYILNTAFRSEDRAVSAFVEVTL